MTPLSSTEKQELLARTRKFVNSWGTYSGNQSIEERIADFTEQEMNAYAAKQPIPLSLPTVSEDEIKQAAENYFESLCITEKSKGYPIKGFMAGCKWLLQKQADYKGQWSLLTPLKWIKDSFADTNKA